MSFLQEEDSKIRQENKFMAEALEELQDSTSRLEAENRTLKKNVSPGKHTGTSAGATLGKVRCYPYQARLQTAVVCHQTRRLGKQRSYLFLLVELVGALL